MSKKMRQKTENRSPTYDIKRPRPRPGRKSTNVLMY